MKFYRIIRIFLKTEITSHEEGTQIMKTADVSFRRDLLNSLIFQVPNANIYNNIRWCADVWFDDKKSQVSFFLYYFFPFIYIGHGTSTTYSVLYYKPKLYIHSLRLEYTLWTLCADTPDRGRYISLNERIFYPPSTRLFAWITEAHKRHRGNTLLLCFYVSFVP